MQSFAGTSYYSANGASKLKASWTRLSNKSGSKLIALRSCNMKFRKFFNTDVAAKIAEEVSEKSLDIAAEIVLKKIQSLVSRPGGGVSSNPGSPPFLQSGELLRGLEIISSPGSRVINSSSPHGLMVEFGTSRMAARPYLRKGFHEAEPLVAKALRRRK